MKLKTVLLLVWLLVLSPLSDARVEEGAPFDAGRAAFSLQIGETEIPYRVFAWFAMPGDEVPLRSAVGFDVQAPGVTVERKGSDTLVIAPTRVGLYPIDVSSGAERIRLNLFVMRPVDTLVDEQIGDYRVGEYPRTPFKGLSVYAPPRGFVEVLAEHRDVAVSPHFRIGQFLSKQTSDWPKYVLLRPELLLKLERILERVNESGIRTDSLTVMSGYRTPWYNRAIGNRTTSSRHLYGGAADIFIDVKPKDGVMDDLNADGRITKADADHLYDLVEGWSSTRWLSPFSGGLGAYGSNTAHGPFIHVDARGYRARWGR